MSTRCRVRVHERVGLRQWDDLARTRLPTHLRAWLVARVLQDHSMRVIAIDTNTNHHTSSIATGTVTVIYRILGSGGNDRAGR